MIYDGYPRSVSRPHKEEWDTFPEGMDITGIAEMIYGAEALHRERRGGHYCSNLARKIGSLPYPEQIAQNRASQEGETTYNSYWCKAEDSETGIAFWARRLSGLKVTWTIDKALEGGLMLQGYIHLNNHTLPDGTRVWWMLTDKGREMLDAIKERRLDVEAPAGLLLWETS